MTSGCSWDREAEIILAKNKIQMKWGRIKESERKQNCGDV